MADYPVGLLSTRDERELRERLLPTLPNVLNLEHGEMAKRIFQSTFIEGIGVDAFEDSTGLGMAKGNGIESVLYGFLVVTDRRLLYFGMLQVGVEYDLQEYMRGLSNAVQTDKVELRIWDEIHYEQVVSLRMRVSHSGVLILRVTDTHRDHRHPHWFTKLGERKLTDLSFIPTIDPDELGEELKGLIEERNKTLMIPPPDVHFVDYAVLREAMAEEGVRVEALRCSSCAGPLIPPKVGFHARCPYCGSTVNIKDLSRRK